MNTRRGTGYYKVPSLLGVWYRTPLGHGGWVSSLEEWFDPKRLGDDYVPSGFCPARSETRSRNRTRVWLESVGGRQGRSDRVPQDLVSE